MLSKYGEKAEILKMHQENECTITNEYLTGKCEDSIGLNFYHFTINLNQSEKIKRFLHKGNVRKSFET